MKAPDLEHGTPCDIPVVIEGPEKLVRVIISPWHFDKKKRRPKSQAYMPSRGTDEISLIRAEKIGMTQCKQRALELCSKKPVQETPRLQGFATALASQIQVEGFAVVDSRDQFCGHAHIAVGIKAAEKGEPPNAEDKLKLSDISEKLMAIFRFMPDPTPDAPEWAGEAL
jgi:hypothetical protein